MKKLFAAALCISMMLGMFTVYAQDSAMDIDRAVAYAVENSPATAQARADIEGKQYSVYKAKLTQKNYQNMDVSSIDMYYVIKGFAVKSAEVEYGAALRSLEEAKKDIEINVKNDFYTYLISVQEKKNAEENLKTANDRLVYAKTMLDAGTISQLDYMNFELLVQGCQMALSSAERNVDLNMTALKNTLGYPEDKALTVTGEFVYDADDVIIPAEEAISLSRKAPTYISLTEARNLSAEKFELAKNYYTTGMHEYRIEKAQYETAEASFETNVRSLDLNIKTMYSNLVGLKDKISYDTKNLEILKTTRDASFLKYQMGTMTAADYRDAEQDYNSARTQLLSSQLSYITTKLQYEKLYEEIPAQNN